VVGMLRVQLLVVGVLAVLLTGVGADQVPDALLRWGDVWGDRLGGLAGVVVLSLLVWRSAHRTGLTHDRELKPLWPRAILLAGLLLLTMLGLRWPNLAGLGVVLLMVAALSWLVGVCPLRRREPHKDHEQGASREGAPGERATVGIEQAMVTARARAGAPPGDVREHVRHLARWLAAVPLAALGVGLVRAAAAPALLREPQAKAWLAYLGVGLALLAALVPLLLERWERRINLAVRDQHSQRPHYEGKHRLYWALCALSLLVYGLAIWRRHEVPVRLGAIGVVTLFLAVALVALNELQRWAERAVPVAGLRSLGFRRTPVLLLLAAWLFVGSLLDEGGFHNVRIQPGADRPGTPVKMEQAFAAWVTANCAGADATTDDEIPMVFVAASGGGVRAAYWTAGVLDRLFPAPAAGSAGVCGTAPSSARLFAASGVSGGSLGIMSWLSRLEGEPTDPPAYQAPVARQTWYDKVLGVDHLSATLSWLLYVEVPRSLLGYQSLLGSEVPDRAEVLEESWERSQPQLRQGFLRAYQQRPAAIQAGSDRDRGDPGPGWLPLALLNGASVDSGCRVLTSPLDLSDYDQKAGGLSCLARPPQSDTPRWSIPRVDQ
jgi:hypothetical protein